MASPTGIIPELLFFPERKKEVIEFLKKQPLPGTLKRELLLGWAQTVGVRINRRSFREVEMTGIDV